MIPRQREFQLNRWGGRRKGAGRKRAPGAKSSVPHRSRAPISRRAPVHVTMGVAPEVYSLRSRRSLGVIHASLRAGAARFGVLVVQTSVQGNHLHLIVEADDAHALSRAMRGLAIRIARGMNRIMQRAGGQVFAERYHTHVLSTPTEVRHAVHYLRNNRRRHLGDRGVLLPASFIDLRSSDALLASVLPEPTPWVLRVGWRRVRAKRSRDTVAT